VLKRIDEEGNSLEKSLLENNGGKGVKVFHNLQLPLRPDMERLIGRLEKQGNLGEDAWEDPAVLSGALQLLDELRAEFELHDKLGDISV